MNAQTMLGLLAEVAVKSTPILAAALLIVRFQRRSTAAFRHAILTAGVLVALALPLVTATLPQWRLAVLPAPHGSGSKLRPVDPLLLQIAGAPPAIHSTFAAIEPSADSRTPSDASIAAMPAAASAMKWTWCDGVLLVWLCGTITTLGVCLAGHVGAIALARSAPPAPSDDLHHQFRRLARQMGIHRPVLLRVGGRVRAPMAMGIFRPTVLLSAETRVWPRSAVDAAILHELAHVKRFDPAVQLLGWLACAVYWFNPLVWLSAARMRMERELACDDAVLRHDIEPAGYARLLVDVARSVQSRWMPAVRPFDRQDRLARRKASQWQLFAEIPQRAPRPRQ
jgi:beta-lactamase regulating signal transducer with metallopeptidase domain